MTIPMADLFATRAATMAATCEPMPDRLATFRVLLGGEVLVGWIRLDEVKRRWVARDLGTERRAASIRRFGDKDLAVKWLAAREPAPAELGRSAYSAPGRRRVVA